jgi:membrane protease YdiL (CAAX protease family)
MKFILEFIAVFTVGILPSLLGTFLHLKNAGYAKKAEHFSAFERSLTIWSSDLTSIAVLLLVAYQQPHGFASIGIYSGQWGNNIGAVFTGFIALAFFVLFLALGQRIILYILKQPADPTIDTTNPYVADNLRYQDVWERLANLATLPFSAISEDLIYRGYLILFLGNLTNTYVPWAVLSAVLMVLLHLYQGRSARMIVHQIFLAIFFTGLTIATQNLLAPITAHIYFNLAGKINMWNAGKNQDKQSSLAEISNQKKFGYILFTVGNIFILTIATIIVLA